MLRWAHGPERIRHRYSLRLLIIQRHTTLTRLCQVPRTMESGTVTKVAYERDKRKAQSGPRSPKLEPYTRRPSWRIHKRNNRNTRLDLPFTPVGSWGITNSSRISGGGYNTDPE